MVSLTLTLSLTLVLSYSSSPEYTEKQRKLPPALSATLSSQKTTATFKTLENNLQPEVLHSLQIKGN